MSAPWSNSATLSNRNGLERLSQEILDFEKYIAPTSSELRKRKEAEDSVKRCVSALFDNYTLQIFGSYTTDLTFPSSDIDFNIHFYEEVNPKKILRDLTRAVQRRRMIHHNQIEFVAHSKTPVVKITLDNGVMVDITTQNPAPSTARTIVWMKEYPELKPMYMILKQSLSAFRTDAHAFQPMQPKYSGLAGFGLLCLIVSYLQLHKPANKNPKDPDYFAHLLLGFLDHYIAFNASEKIISLENGGKCFSIDEKTSLSQVKYSHGKLFVIDPDVPENNVCRSLGQFDAIQAIFQHCAKVLREQISATNTRSVLSSIIKVPPHDHSTPREELGKFQPYNITISGFGCRTIPNFGGQSNRFSKRARQFDTDELEQNRYTSRRYEDNLQEYKYPRNQWGVIYRGNKRTRQDDEAEDSRYTRHYRPDKRKYKNARDEEVKRYQTKNHTRFDQF
ncbi:hypothetical protein BY458DRAFT_554558 [Sporodiniella umbellata]|nr:hypothetical protein BY458DRAFT_554558 [Sporodiniella umbellata]